MKNPEKKKRKKVKDFPGIDLDRYRKVRRFFINVFVQAVWQDIVLNRPILRWFRTDPLARWREVARKYRALAVEMGGVLIKLGQFLSIRVDILPPEVTMELAGLQDEVPPGDFADIRAQIEADFGRDIDSVFEWFSREPLGSASLAQAHSARIASGGEVVVKVLRPGIDVLVETDLAAIGLALRWLKIYRHVARRVDLDWIEEEFSTVTRRELDFGLERKNAERFASIFSDDAHVCVPKVYHEYCAAHTLTMENVGYIKISDLDAIEAAGISRAKVADIIYNLYMRQVFETHFVHVDPHPGNLFVRPLPHPDEIEAGITEFRPGNHAPYKPDRPFQIAFVDFGMTAVIPERMRTALREYAIGVGTHDAQKIVKALGSAGALLDGADTKRLEEAHEAFFDRFWGVSVGDFRNVAMNEVGYFLHEYRDVIYEAPFQFQADMLFVVRAVGILSGMAANLDPDFDVWAKTVPYAERYAKEELDQNWQGWAREAGTIGQRLAMVPTRLDRMLSMAERGSLVVRTSPAPDSKKDAQRLKRSVDRLAWMAAASGMLISSAILHVGRPDEAYDTILAGLAVMAFVWGIRKR